MSEGHNAPATAAGYLVSAWAGPRYRFAEPGARGLLCLPCKDKLQHKPNYLVASASPDEWATRCYGCGVRFVAEEKPA